MTNALASRLAELFASDPTLMQEALGIATNAASPNSRPESALPAAPDPVGTNRVQGTISKVAAHFKGAQLVESAEKWWNTPKGVPPMFTNLAVGTVVTLDLDEHGKVVAVNSLAGTRTRRAATAAATPPMTASQRATEEAKAKANMRRDAIARAEREANDNRQLAQLAVPAAPTPPAADKPNACPLCQLPNTDPFVHGANSMYLRSTECLIRQYVKAGGTYNTMRPETILAFAKWNAANQLQMSVSAKRLESNGGSNGRETMQASAASTPTKRKPGRPKGSVSKPAHSSEEIDANLANTGGIGSDGIKCSDGAHDDKYAAGARFCDGCGLSLNDSKKGAAQAAPATSAHAPCKVGGCLICTPEIEARVKASHMAGVPLRAEIEARVKQASQTVADVRNELKAEKARFVQGKCICNECGLIFNSPSAFDKHNCEPTPPPSGTPYGKGTVASKPARKTPTASKASRKSTAKPPSTVSVGLDMLSKGKTAPAAPVNENPPLEGTFEGFVEKVGSVAIRIVNAGRLTGPQGKGFWFRADETEAGARLMRTVLAAPVGAHVRLVLARPTGSLVKFDLIETAHEAAGTPEGIETSGKQKPAARRRQPTDAKVAKARTAKRQARTQAR